MITFLYFLSGLPLGFFTTFVPVQLRALEIELSKIGLFYLAGLSWSLKPLWAPFLDRFGKKTFWLILFNFGLFLCFLALSFYITNPERKLFIFFLILLTLFSALYDTALDGWFIEFLPKKFHGKANGIRVSAYRLALIFSGGVAVALSQYLNSHFLVLTLGLFFLLFPFFILINPSPNPKEDEKASFSNKEFFFLYPFKIFWQNKSGFLILVFVFSYKVGDALLGGMVYPFWVDRGFTKTEIGLIAGTLGTLLTILGALVGGFITSRIGVKKALFFLGLAQAFSNLGYFLAALPFVPGEVIYGASILESFTGGLGTSAFLTYLTTLCQKRYASSQYAILSTLFNLSTTLSKGISGVLAQNFGYALFFFISFLVALAPLAFIPYLNSQKGREES